MDSKKNPEPLVMVTSEQSIRFQFGTSINDETYKIVQAFCRFINEDNNYLLEEVVPSYHTVTLFYEKELKNPNDLIEDIVRKWSSIELTESLTARRSIKIPVCYDEKFSEDMDRITKHTGLSRNEVIALHTGQIYTVYMIGFLPGFPYLGELDAALCVPRLEKPRLKVPKGTVGIGFNQTGIYPLESPGGWNILGRTPLDLYCPNREESFLLQAGDFVSFYSISVDEYFEMEHELEINSQ
ncbi:5-oxoprolinase subunit PxpB [Sporosarcina sp. FA9]|uniref:5-oxoprolinase subunit PxpB n=1 Tax=Sporosarcina sp. FA9 TaxID=3413030 RepID=UPI003F660049